MGLEGLYEASKQNVDWVMDGWVMGDTPQTVMTTRAPAVLKSPCNSGNSSHLVTIEEKKWRYTD